MSHPALPQGALDPLVQALRARIQEVEQLYAQARGLRHDLWGHLDNIQSLARSGDAASLKAYIAQVDAGIRGFELAMETGSPVTDVTISDKRRQCRAVSPHIPHPPGSRAHRVR